jgi:DNA topoisomerase IB
MQTVALTFKNKQVMNTLVNIDNKKIVIAANARGHYSNKFNRAAKLATGYKELENKLYRIAERGISSNTEHARCAIGCLLLMQTGIRIGNEASAEGYMTIPHPNSKKEPEFVKTFGLTTLLPEHITTSKQIVNFDFTGKKQVNNTFRVRCKLMSSWLRTLSEMEMPTLLGINDRQLTRFIKKYVGAQYCPKDFRTMRANIIAGKFVADNFVTVSKKKDFNALLNQMYQTVSEALNNTKGVCKKNYVSDLMPEYLMEKYFNKN